MGKTSFNLALISDEDLTREYMRRHNERRRVTPPPKVLRPCQHCGKEFGARELRGHVAACRRQHKSVAQ